MNMYVWHDVLEDYTSGNICALAPDEQSAWEALFRANRNAYFSVMNFKNSDDRWRYQDKQTVPFTAAKMRTLVPNRVRPKKYTKPFAVATWGGG